MVAIAPAVVTFSHAASFSNDAAHGQWSPRLRRGGIDVIVHTTLFAPEPLCHADAVLQRLPGELVVRSPAPQWAYAASFQRLDTPTPRTSLLIVVTLQVRTGRVGIGCLTLDHAAFLDEVFVGPTPEPTRAEVVIVEPAAMGSLVIRNVSADGDSEARIISIETQAIDDDDQSRQPPLAQPHPVPRWSRYYSTEGTTLAERVRVRRFTALREPVILGWGDGTRIVIRPSDQLSRALYVSGTYEPNTLTILRALTPAGGVFVDIGANTGVVSVAAAAWVGPDGRVFSFEPSRREFERLVENLALNNLSQVVPVPAAIADREGTMPLTIAAPGFGGLNTLAGHFPYAGVATERIEQVQALTFDAFAERQRLSRVDVIKNDVEGAEGIALTGAARVLQRYRPAIVLEIFSRSLQSTGWDRARLTALLRSARYCLFRIDEATARPVRLLALDEIDEQNAIALPDESVDTTVRHLTFGS
jgi:FkbM family methyltransferase